MSRGIKRDALLAFIEAYRGLPELWDQHCPAYSNRTKKAAAYNILIEKLKVCEQDATRDTVVKKINNLRCTFRKELNKVEDSRRSGAGELYVPSLWYFNELMFLVGQDTTTNPNEFLDQETPDPSQLLDQNMVCGYEDHGIKLEDSLQMPTPLTPTTSETTQTSFTVPPTKRMKTDPASPSQNLLLKARHYLVAEDDECLILAKGYAVKMRKLTPEQLMFADKVINDVLLDGRMGLLNRHSIVVHDLNSSR